MAYFLLGTWHGLILERNHPSEKFEPHITQKMWLNGKETILPYWFCDSQSLKSEKQSGNKKLVFLGHDPFNQSSDRENWSSSKGGPLFLKLFRLDRTYPLSFGPKRPEILVEWIAPLVSVLFKKVRWALYYNGAYSRKYGISNTLFGWTMILPITS